MLYFGKPIGRVEIQTTSKNSQRYYTTKHLIRDLLISNTLKFYVRVGEFRDIYLRRDRSMRSGMELAWEIQLTDCKQTCLTGLLEYKYRVIFVLILGAICTLRGAVG